MTKVFKFSKAKQEAGIENFGEYCTYYPYNDNSHEYPNSNECYHVFYKSLIRNKSFFPSSNWTLNSDISRINEKLRTYDGKSKITRKRAWDNPVFYTNLMPDGSFMNIHILENNVFIAVDTNGKKNPNKLGHDIFIFTINKNNDSLSYINSASAGRECSNSSTSETNGYYCSYYALRDECPFDSSKKYFECLP